MYSIKKILVVLLCTFPLTTYATELFVTEEALDAVIKNFISDMSDEGVDIDISVSTSSIKGSRDKFNIQNLRVYNSTPSNLLTVKEISCSGYKINDLSFNTSLTRLFKMPPLIDVKNSLDRPSKCLIEGVNFSFIDSFLVDEISQLMPDAENSNSLNMALNLLKDIDIKIDYRKKRNDYMQDIHINFADSIFFGSETSASVDIEEMYQFIDTFMNNVIFKYWGYQSYESLYKDTTGDTSDVMKDFMAELEFQPTVFLEHIPRPIFELLLNSSSVRISWTEDQFEYYKRSNPEIEGFILAMHAMTISILDKDQFAMMLSTQEQLAPLILFQDKFYEIYVSAFYAAKEFSQNPSGMEIILSFDEGINLMPDIDMALQNPGFYFPSLLMQMFMPLKITFKANPENR
tara:strand:- start:28 stop:1236 length:1209 start_codon:yes stop_codon:yes gene_type:complete